MKKKTIVFTSLFTMFVFLFIVFTACKKSTACFSMTLYEQHKNDFCLDDCPGVTGCDGKIYCNTCYAHRIGIEVVP
jgi:hypothetical protein